MLFLLTFQDEDARLGDPRHCPRHPRVVTSDPYGLHDAPCGLCEYESEADREGPPPAPAPPPPVDPDPDLPF